VPPNGLNKALALCYNDSGTSHAVGYTGDKLPSQAILREMLDGRKSIAFFSLGHSHICKAVHTSSYSILRRSRGCFSVADGSEDGGFRGRQFSGN
jgi:hypothetical protein